MIYDTPQEIETAARRALKDTDADGEQLARLALELIIDLAELLTKERAA